MSDKKTRSIKVDYLARVEGEGAMDIKIEDGKLIDVKLKIFEPPRFFEGFLQGRSYTEVPDIVARICGICPAAYQMGSVHCFEKIFDIKIEDPIRELRRLYYCGEWISSHVLHTYMLHAPDFHGYHSAIHMAADHPEHVTRGLELKKLGASVMTFVGGREIHPINVAVGGFYRVFSKSEVKALLPDLKRGLELSIESVKWFATFDFPDFDQDYNFVSTKHPDEYSLNEGNVVSSGGLNIDQNTFFDHFEEIHMEHSTAKHCVTKADKKPYLTGPMARLYHNSDQLPTYIQDLAKEVGMVDRAYNNPFKSLLARALETVFAFDEAIRICENYEEPNLPKAEFEPKAGTAVGITEAPRGICVNGFTCDEKGDVIKADILAPTSQNQPQIEEDLKDFITKYIDLPDDKLQWQCEQAIRNYDPCISCSAHFLKLNVDRK